MCNMCNTKFYIKTKQYLRPVLAPATREQELRDKLLELTGEVYVLVPHKFCPVCGCKVNEVQNDG